MDTNAFMYVVFISLLFIFVECVWWHKHKYNMQRNNKSSVKLLPDNNAKYSGIILQLCVNIHIL